MSELERQLIELGHGLDHPAVPDLTAGVSARLVDRPAPRRGRLSIPPRRALVLAAILSLLVAGTVVAAVPAVREAVLDTFRLRGATVERRERAPAARIERRLGLGERVSLADARERVGFPIVAPRRLGTPDKVYVFDGVPGGQVSLVYGPRRTLPRTATTGVGLLITEFRGDLLPEYAAKIAGQATTVERVQTGMGRGLWIAGAPHDFFYRDPRGRVRMNSLRLAANVLLVERGRLLIRLEGTLSKRHAITIADALTRVR